VLHPNAPLTPRGRLRLCLRVARDQVSITQAAREFCVSRQTASKWVNRYLAGGVSGLHDRSCRPLRCRPKVAPGIVRRIVRSRQRQRIGAHRIAWKLGVCRSTVCAVLRRVSLSKIRDLDPRADVAVRYEWEQPGDLVHVDTKRLGRVGAGGGKRFRGPAKANQHVGIGWEFVHVAIDDHSRLAYAEVLDDERGDTTAAFMDRAVAFYATHGVTVRRVLSDNARCYYSHAFRGVLACHGIKERKTAPYHPQTNGKAEAMVKVLTNSWAYVRPYEDGVQRTAALDAFMRVYNHHRPHGGLGGATPISRIGRQ
jgi:transposase InsO family protein